jgi:hypothetical protein
MERNERIYIPPKRKGLPLRYEFEHPARHYRWLALFVLAVAIGVGYLVLHR